MAQAKVLNEPQIKKAIATIKMESRCPLRDTVMLALSFQAGLCAQEIAWLELDDVTDAEGNLIDTVKVSKTTRLMRRKPGKTYRRPRVVPMTGELHGLLKRLIAQEQIAEGPLFFNQYGEQMSPNAVQKQLTRIFQAAGFKGASSHSGRRTFITRAARIAGSQGCSLKDVQHLAGHASVATTEKYIDLSPRAPNLVNAIWNRQDAA